MSNVVQGHAEPDPTVYVPPSRTGVQPQGDSVDPWTGPATTGDPVPDGGYAFTPDQLRSIADKWEALGLRFEKAKTEARQLTDAEGPGAEYASINNAERIRLSGLALSDALDKRMQYCQAMAKKFEAAIADYRQAEEQAVIEIRHSTQGRF
ncbi:hypothetical protein SAMN05421630_103400 [Prauserella marina]|uniref:Uncharacterized protein n=1 Tax=Prauserella marina TaxID=530584 RepID=A0A1G6P1D3_9PSEU|nr:hypothetical protein [Prauserella marina]PWV82621.1 hypothetical protein DES30_102864 [Prauserella marina]SDC73235.1 hypothetical protein SAMN05421630_103400 [Prauserella marina]